MCRMLWSVAVGVIVAFFRAGPALACLALASCASAPFSSRHSAAQPRSAQPNIVVVLADDLGYGDVGAYNAASLIPTPVMDRLARDGVRFTDAHSNSAVCTPTRYGLLTGRYAWRSRLKKGVLWSNGDTLIEAGRATLASMLRDQGYYTAAVGKWHLGLHWAVRPGATADRETPQGSTDWIDYTGPVTGGPLAAGFDEFFGIAASLDMRDYVYVDGEQVVEPPTAALPGIPLGRPGFYRPGPAGPSFRPERVIDDLTARAVDVITRRSRADEPFFLYLAMAAPHTPMLPTGEFVGKTTLGPYGDFVAQTDAALGVVLQALERTGIAERTLVIVASDNGPAPAGGIAELLPLGHDAAGGWRGAKHDLFEGGHRVPFIVRWPGVSRAGSVVSTPVVMTDVMRTLADVVGATVPAGAAEDSVSFAAVLKNPDLRAPRHEAIVMHSSEGAFAIRQDRWKLLLAPGSGGVSPPVPGSRQESGLPPVQLYDLEADPRETINLQARHPSVVRRLQRLLQEYQRSGRSR